MAEEIAFEYGRTLQYLDVRVCRTATSQRDNGKSVFIAHRASQTQPLKPVICSRVLTLEETQKRSRQDNVLEICVTGPLTITSSLPGQEAKRMAGNNVSAMTYFC